LKQIAGAAGLDRRAFDACLDEGRFTSAMRKAIDEAGRYAVTSSPAFLVNGALAPPLPPFLPPYEFLKRIIEEELLRVSAAANRR
jgi:predicted DsbA family dithiol-disulfide isomerase